MRIVIAQLDCVLGDVDANADTAVQTVTRAREDGADLVVFPELFLTGYWLGGITEGTDVAIRLNDPRLVAVAEAGGDQTGVVIGFAQEGRRLDTYNSSAYLAGGQVVHVHQKNYLVTYRQFEEGKYFSPGPRTRAFDTPQGRMAMLICNDAWQPPLVFIAIQDGARVLLVPSTSGHGPFDDLVDTERYWRDITRFYASLFQCYVVFANRIGAEAGVQFWGGSHILDPWGNTVAEAPRYDEAVLSADIDLSAVRDRRRQVPFLKETRLGHLVREFNWLLSEVGDG